MQAGNNRFPQGGPGGDRVSEEMALEQGLTDGQEMPMEHREDFPRQREQEVQRA